MAKWKSANKPNGKRDKNFLSTSKGEQVKEQRMFSDAAKKQYASWRKNLATVWERQDVKDWVSEFFTDGGRDYGNYVYEKLGDSGAASADCSERLEWVRDYVKNGLRELVRVFVGDDASRARVRQKFAKCVTTILGVRKFDWKDFAELSAALDTLDTRSCDVLYGVVKDACKRWAQKYKREWIVDALVNTDTKSLRASVAKGPRAVHAAMEVWLRELLGEVTRLRLLGERRGK